MLELVETPGTAPLVGDAMAQERFAKRALKQRDRAILESALARFNEHGCFRTNLDDVVADVGVGKGTLYRHYGSREELFSAALRDGSEALLVLCRDIQAKHAGDPDAGLRAVVVELVSRNQAGEPASPETLARLRCSCRWLTGNNPHDGTLEFALIPVVRSWQAAGLFDRATEPGWIAAVMAALIGSPAVASGDGHEAMERSRTHPISRARTYRSHRESHH